MSSKSPTTRKRPRRSAGQRLLLATGVVVALCICFLSVTALRGLSPAAQQDGANSRTTATVQSAQQDDAGATVVAQIKAAATQTALAGLSATTSTPAPSATPQSYSTGDETRVRQAEGSTLVRAWQFAGSVLYMAPTWARNAGTSK